MVRIRVLRKDRPELIVKLPGVPAIGDILWLQVIAEDGGTIHRKFVVTARVWHDYGEDSVKPLVDLEVN